MTRRTAEDEIRDPGLARLFGLTRARFEALGGPRGRVVVPALTPEEALAIDTIWKRSARRVRPRRGQDFPCGLRDLDVSLRETLGLGLEEALVLRYGPLRLRPALRSAEAERTAVFWEKALGHPLCERVLVVREWVERLRATGALGARPFDGERGRSLLTALEVGGYLPRDPPIERSALASELLGDPHALDDGRPAGDRLVALLTALDARDGERLSAGERRALLSRFGVLCDPASATVLTLGLRPCGESPLEQALRLLTGQHVVLTLGQLSRARPRFERGLLVRLCENPAVVLRAEDRLGAAVDPLVCTGGWPGSAVCFLLEALRDAGARFEHHGDFDWDGVAIHRWLRERYGVGSWRFDAHAYERALGELSATPAPLAEPRHRLPIEDPLVVALERHRRAVPEEAVLDALVRDVRQARSIRAANSAGPSSMTPPRSTVS